MRETPTLANRVPDDCPLAGDCYAKFIVIKNSRLLSTFCSRLRSNSTDSPR
jgi:hypothetical protein